MHNEGKQQQNEKATSWRKYLQIIWPISGQYPRYINSSHNSISKKPIKKFKKMGRSPESIFLQRRCSNVQQAHEKMLGIANPQRNINQNHYEVLPHLCQNGYHQNVCK